MRHCFAVVMITLRMYIQPKPSVICERVDTFYFNAFPCQESQGHTHLEERASKDEQIFSVLFSKSPPPPKICVLSLIKLN